MTLHQHPRDEAHPATSPMPPGRGRWNWHRIAQVAWVVLASLPILSSFLSGVVVLTFSLPVLGVSIPILRYRLWDIDVIINRTLVIAALFQPLRRRIQAIIELMLETTRRFTWRSSLLNTPQPVARP